MLRSLPSRSSLLLIPLTALAWACSEDPSSPVGAPDGEALSAVASSDCTLPGPDHLIATRIRALQDEVTTLEDSGTLSAGPANALAQHLTNALRQLEREEYCATLDQLAAFREQMETFIDEESVSDRDAFELRLQSRLATSSPEDLDPGDEEAYAPGVTGELRTLEVGGEEIVYEVIDGLAIFTGDIVLGYADEVEAAASVPPPGADGPARGGPCTIDGLICARWTDGVIGFDFLSDWGDAAENERMRNLVFDAIAMWRAETGMRFQRRSGGERLVFRMGDGCSSWIGRNPVTGLEPQYVFLNNGLCDDAGVIAHEIGHAIGLYHEQSRNDRNDWVDVNFDVIQDDKEVNFWQYLFLGNDVGEYDYGSILHYHCNQFREDGAVKNSIRPKRRGAGCEAIGQRDTLSDGDILGAYWLYRPQYQIGGATSGETRDRFELFTDFTTEPVADEYIEWLVNTSPAGTGPTFSTVDAGLAEGTYHITARIVIHDVVLAARTIDVTIANDPPVVDLGADRTVDMNRTFTVTADVTDTEDGSCPLSACTYTWDPEPESDLGGAAQYRFPTDGTATISVTVEDGFGATGSDEVDVNVVDSPPVPVIEIPSGGSTFSTGATVERSGFATDANYGPGPGPGVLPCSQLRWSSSDPSDVLPFSGGCDGTIVFGDPGRRTVTLEATDGTGNTAATEVAVDVEGCDGGCAPDISFAFDTPADFDDGAYDASFTEPGYYLGTSIQMTAAVDDLDGPTSPIALEWRVRPPSFFGPSEEFVIGSTTVTAPAESIQTWRPSDDVTPWSNCVTVPLPYVIKLEATDGDGNTRVFHRTVYLACPLV